MGEYVSPILWEGKLLGAVTAGFLPMEKAEAHSRIARAMTGSPDGELETALRLYEQNILTTAVPEQTLLPSLDFVASYLAMTLPHGPGKRDRPASGKRAQAKRHRRTIDPRRGFFASGISEPHHHIPARGGMPLLGKQPQPHAQKAPWREHEHLCQQAARGTAKRYLLETDDSMLSIALSVGFRDANYFARVFRQLIGIQPTEFRRRYR